MRSAKGENIDLHEAQRVDVVLVPFDHLPAVHRRGLDGDEIVEPVMGQHEAARMLREMARRADEFADEVEREAQPPVGEVEAELLRALFRHAFVRPAPDLRG